MAQPNSFHTSNLLLGALSAADLELLKPHLTHVPLHREQVLVAAGEAIKQVYFPDNGVASIVSVLGSGQRTEVGIFGREGVSATCLLLGTDRSPHETFVQIDGSTAQCIDTASYLAAVQQSGTLRDILLRYVQTFLVQAAQSTATNAHQRLEALARWLLMAHDRVDGDEFLLTHEFMGMMIAADRSGVTVTLHILEGAGMIQSKRGRVIIKDREKLEELAGDSYGIPEREYRRLIGPFGKGPSSSFPNTATFVQH